MDSKDTLIGMGEPRETAAPSKAGASTTYVRWLTVAIIMGFGLMFFVVAWQQTQIDKMQLKLNDDQLDVNYDPSEGEELRIKANDTGAIISRQRRRASNNPSQLQNFTPFAHLTQIMNSPRADRPYMWSRPRSRGNYFPSSYYSHVRISPPNENSYVEAIQVICSGWFYVYAQVPYKSRSTNELGHKIVKLGNCGENTAVTLLQTMIQLPGHPDGEGKRNWKYLGGIVHLSAGDHIQVQPVTNLSPDNISTLETAELPKRVGEFFGLYEVQKEPLFNQRNCQSCP